MMRQMDHVALFRADSEDDCVVAKVGDAVRKVGGDYTFEGWLAAIFIKRSGAVRVVVENEDGLLHVFSPRQLRHVASQVPW